MRIDSLDVRTVGAVTDVADSLSGYLRGVVTLDGPLDAIAVDAPRDRALGFMIASSDLMVQTADRCYLEKCRDRLYPEFVLGGVAEYRQENTLNVN